jgi:hypothetical protein
MAPWNELTWDKAMQRAYEAVSLSERLYEEIDAEEGRSNVDFRGMTAVPSPLAVSPPR